MFLRLNGIRHLIEIVLELAEVLKLSHVFFDMLPESLLKLDFLLVYIFKHIYFGVGEVAIDVLAQLRNFFLQNSFPIFKAYKLLFHFVNVIQVSQLMSALNLLCLAIDFNHEEVFVFFTVGDFGLQSLL